MRKILTKEEIRNITQKVKETLLNVSVRQITDGSVQGKFCGAEEMVLEVLVGEEKQWVCIPPSSASQEFIVRKIVERINQK